MQDLVGDMLASGFKGAVRYNKKKSSTPIDMNHPAAKRMTELGVDLA